MRPELYEFLWRCDSPPSLEPSDYDRLREEIAALKPLADEIVGQFLDAEECGESGSWLVRWGIFEPGCVDSQSRVGVYIFEMAVVFSVWGRMVCMWSNSSDANSLLRYPVRAVEDMLRSRGFVVVSVSELQVRYDGPCRHEYPYCRTWWDRFFGDFPRRASFTTSSMAAQLS